MADVEAAVAERRLVIFHLAGEAYGVDVGVVHEIMRMQPITRVPQAPSYVEGVINLRGRIIPTVDMRKRFSLPESEPGKDSRIMVVDAGGQSISIVVDGVSEVVRLPEDTVEHLSRIVASADTDYLLGIANHEGRMIILLDLDKVLAKDAVKSLPEVLSTTERGEPAAETAADSGEREQVPPAGNGKNKPPRSKRTAKARTP